MDLKTKDGMILISEKEYEIIHDMSKMIPELIRSLVIALNRCDEKIEMIRRERDSFCKLRRILTETQGKLDLLFPKKEGGKANE